MHCFRRAGAHRSARLMFDRIRRVGTKRNGDTAFSTAFTVEQPRHWLYTFPSPTLCNRLRRPGSCIVLIVILSANGCNPTTPLYIAIGSTEVRIGTLNREEIAQLVLHRIILSHPNCYTSPSSSLCPDAGPGLEESIIPFGLAAPHSIQLTCGITAYHQ
jgi:hypothetical protein